MPSYPPPAGTYTDQHPQVSRPPTSRARTTTATAEKYRPRTYSHPPPNQPDPNRLGPSQQPDGVPTRAPYPQQEMYTTAPTPLPMPQPAPIYPPPQQQQAPFFPPPRHSSYAHPPRPLFPTDDYHSRPSHSSQRSSRHSHDSRRSRHSKHSRYSTDDDRHDGGRHHGDQAKRVRRIDDIERRPTMGDSVIAFFGLIKSALGPREK